MSGLATTGDEQPKRKLRHDQASVLAQLRCTRGSTAMTREACVFDCPHNKRTDIKACNPALDHSASGVHTLHASNLASLNRGKRLRISKEEKAFPLDAVVPYRASKLTNSSRHDIRPACDWAPGVRQNHLLPRNVSVHEGYRPVCCCVRRLCVLSVMLIARLNSNVVVVNLDPANDTIPYVSKEQCARFNFEFVLFTMRKLSLVTAGM